ncbi:hypothetical protein CSB08_01275 [Candidatus Gracilibacteria bacterium]|nr:MAG: hypothetical protein CSB08_01275 [Candidatus Gracilibacteria bacterium]PIE85398.1 MAG: hypothetical protein CSA08_02370 [Candidatus Gracilibacteria bacterium]
MKSKLREKAIASISMYIIFFLISIYLYNKGYLDRYAIAVTIGLLFLLIKDILLFFIDFDEVDEITNKIDKLNKDYNSSLISFGDYSLFLNRNYFFPIILVIYLIFILFYQLGVIYLGNSMYNLINSNLLGITVISGFMTTFNEDIDKKYQTKSKTINGLYKNILTSSILSVIGAYIILLQVYSLGFLGYVISLVSGLLIFFVGISIMLEEKV